MKPIDQQYFYNKETGEIGDCIRAVTASLLEIDRDSVPHFVKDNPGHEWYDKWELFMIRNGITPHMIAGPFEVVPKPAGYYLASGPSSRGVKHIVIMWDGKMVHDPHPTRSGIKSIEAIWMLT